MGQHIYEQATSKLETMLKKPSEQLSESLKLKQAECARQPAHHGKGVPVNSMMLTSLVNSVLVSHVTVMGVHAWGCSRN